MEISKLFMKLNKLFIKLPKRAEKATLVVLILLPAMMIVLLYLAQTRWG